MFASDAHRSSWASIVDALSVLPVLAPTTGRPDADRAVENERSRSSLDAAVAADVFDTVVAVVGAEQLSELRAGDVDELLEAGAHILADFEDRTLLNGVSEIGPSGDDPERPLVRRFRRPGPSRVVTSGALFAVMLAAGFRLVELTATSTTGRWFAYATVVVLACGALIWALVDWDTFYLDTPTFWPLTLLAWCGAVAAAFADGAPSRVLAGVAICAGGAIVFVGSNLVYFLVRGVNGMGFGDTLILFATAGVPTALTGSWQLGYMAIIGSMLIGIVGWLLLRLAGRVTRESRFAFGPYLAIGWAAAAAMWVS
jgi:prepilin signal peptidase PulO-like enzyme (type II secretory pathway)